MRKFKICLSVFMMALTIIMPLQIASGAESTTEIDLPVIMYHHINKNPKYLNNYTVSPDEFRRDLEYLKDNGYQTVSASQLIGFTQGKEQLPEKPIRITTWLKTRCCLWNMMVDLLTEPQTVGLTWGLLLGFNSNN